MKNKKIKQFIISCIPFLNINKKIIALHGKAQKYIKNDKKIISAYYSNKIYKKYHCILSSKAQIGNNLVLPHPIGIVIGEGVKIGDNCYIYQNVTIGRKQDDVAEYPTIGNNVKIYAGAVLVGNITVGDNVIIGANSFVTKDIPSNSIAVGIPARIIKREEK